MIKTTPTGHGKAGIVVLALAMICIAGESVARKAAADSSLELVDRIVAIVDEEAILQSDVDREVALYYLEARNAGKEVAETDAEIRKETFDRLIESKLIIAAARQEEIEISDDAVQGEVQANVDKLVKYYGSRQALDRALQDEGMTLATYRKRATGQLRDQHYMRAVIQRFIRPQIEIREEEVDAWYDAHLDDVPATPDSLSLWDILIPVEPDAKVQQEIQRKLGVVLQKLGEGTDFAEVARKYSEGPSASRGGYIGRVNRGDLFSPVLENAVFSLGEGETSQPVVSERGVHILHVAKVDSTGRFVSQIFFPLEITPEDVDRAQAVAEKAHDRLMAGESFAAVAAEMSGDPASSQKGGVLGTYALTDLSPTIQEQLADVQAGETTAAFLTKAGFYIFHVDARVDGHRMALDDIRDQVRRAVESEKLETALADYVEGLHKRFVVDIKS